MTVDSSPASPLPVPPGRESLASILSSLARIQRVAHRHGAAVLDVEAGELAALDLRIGEVADELEK